MKLGSALDGNVLAGLLAEVFSFEPTASMSTCSGCGDRGPMATWVVFVSAPGIVARCANCMRVQIRVVREEGGRMWVDLSGVETIDVAAPSV